jgi:hypothetical protein
MGISFFSGVYIMATYTVNRTGSIFTMTTTLFYLSSQNLIHHS